MTVISKNELMAMGYPRGTAEGIIREAKALMIQKGYSFYSNRRLGRVPREVVEEIIGTTLIVEGVQASG